MTSGEKENDVPKEGRTVPKRETDPKSRDQEDQGQEGRSQEGRSQEDQGQEGHGQEGHNQEGQDQKGHGQEGRSQEDQDQDGRRQEDQGQEGHGQEGVGSGSAPTAAAADKRLTDAIGRLDLSVEKSMRYHQRRRAHYDRIHRALMFGVILSGSAAFSMVLGQSALFGAIAAVLGALDLVWSFSHRARDHEMLFRRFSDLAAELRTLTPNDENYQRWQKRRIQIEADEPPIFWAVEADCFNEACHAFGRVPEGGFNTIPFRCRVSMNWFRYERAQFLPKTEKRRSLISRLLCRT